MKSIQDEMMQLADGAITVAKNSYQVEIDYSLESIKRLEPIFDSLHKEIPRSFLSKLFKRGLTEKQIYFAALMLGAYIGETIRRLHGGEWMKENESVKKERVKFSVGDITIYPAEKAYKRIVNGAEDDIWFYYKVFFENLKQVDH